MFVLSLKNEKVTEQAMKSLQENGFKVEMRDSYSYAVNDLVANLLSETVKEKFFSKDICNLINNLSEEQQNIFKADLSRNLDKICNLFDVDTIVNVIENTIKKM